MKVLAFIFITAGLFTYFLDNLIIQGWAEEDVSSGEDVEWEPPAHYRLEEYLMHQYNYKLMPQRDQSKPVFVKFRIALYQIVEVNEPQQYVMLNSWIVESWDDDFLWWDPAKFDNLTEIVLPHEALWRPDTTLYNSIVMEDSESRRLQSIKVETDMKRKTARVSLMYPTLYKFSCTLNLRLFPFDEQNCIMIFGSWSHDNLKIDYFPDTATMDNGSKSAIDTENCIENEGWNIINTNVSRVEQSYKCCPNNYTLLNFAIHIQRKPLYYLVNLIAPTSIITLIAIVGFFSSITVNEMREEKITLGITTLLSMSILIFMVSDKMPSTSSFIPLIGWFYMCMMFLIAFATLCSSFVINVQKKGLIGQRPSTATMRWARRVGKLIWLEMPLLMKQAYALKAKALKNRWRFATMFKAKRRTTTGLIEEADPPMLFVPPTQKTSLQEKRAKQNQRKASAWQKTWKKISRPTSISGSTLSTMLPAASLGAALSDSASMMGSFGRVAASRRPDALNTGNELMNMSIVSGSSYDIKFIDEDRISEDSEEWDSPSHAPGSPTHLGIPNGGSAWPPTLSSDRARRSPSTLSVPNNQQTTSFRARKRQPTMADILEGVDPLLHSPSAHQRNLAEIEYDWLAAVVERLFLCLFMILFFFMSVGINAIGAYFWLFVTVDQVNE